MKDARTKLRNAVGLAAVSVLVAWALWAAGALTRWENTTWDWRVRQTAGANDAVTRAARDSVCVILLDQASLDWGQATNGWSWPWPREVYAVMVDFCRQAGAASVGFDVLYTEPSVYGVWDDEALGEAIGAYGRFLAVPFVHGLAENRTPEITMPIGEVAGRARALANVSDTPDADGIFRRATLWRHLEHEAFPGGVVPSLGAAAYLLERGGLVATGDSTPDTWSVDRVTALPQRPILQYCARDDRWPVYGADAVIQSALQLLEGDQPTLAPEVLRGRHVLFGFSAPGLLDLRPTPLSRVSPGVNIHATVLTNLLGDGFVRESPHSLALPVMAVLAVLTAFAVLRVSRSWQTLGLLLVAAAVPSGIGLLAAGAGWWWPVVPHTASQVLAAGGALLLAWATEGRQKRFIRQAFRHYLSPDVIQRIMDDPDRLKLGGERRELSIFFSDLEGFTSISEGLEPQDLTQLLNAYLSDMTDIILDEGGTLDKYEGDAIVAFWNAPLDQPDHAERACRATVRCQRRLAERRAEFVETYGAELKMRIGLNSGPVTVGNLGSKQRFDYTVLGDAANLAARLEGANKVFGTYTMISAETLAVAGDTVLVRELGALRVVGRSQPVQVYELAGLAGDPAPAGWADYARGLALCREGRAQAAKAVFDTLTDDPAAVSWSRRLNDEPEGFDAVWNLTRK